MMFIRKLIIYTTFQRFSEDPRLFGRNAVKALRNKNLTRFLVLQQFESRFQTKLRH